MPISKIKTSGIEDNAVTSSQLEDNSVTSAKIGVDVIVAEDIANNAITVAELADGAVTSAKISGLTGASTGILQADGDGTISTTVISSDSITEGNSSVEVVDTGTGHVAVTTDGSERTRFDASGNVTVKSSGGTTPTYDFSTLGEGLNFRYWDESGARHADIVAIGNTPAGATQDLRFFTNSGGSPGTASEAMRIESDGDVAMGTTTTGPRLAISDSRTNNYAVKINCSRGGGETGFLVQFTENTPAFSNSVGSIRSNGSSVSYLTTSDYRLKENVVDMTGAIARVKSLSPKRFNFIADTDDTVVDGFLAHEAQSVVPEAVSGTHDAVDADGNPDYQGIDQSKLVPLLTAALKEAITRIETLEAKVVTLEGN